MVTITSILKELSCGKLWNRTRMVYGINTAGVMWHDNSWKVIENNATFDDVKEREYKPIAEFYYQKELAQYIYNKINK